MGEIRPQMRVASLAPSATATLQAMGRTEALVAATHHCDVRDAERIGGWLNPDFDRLDALDPDLVVTADALQADLRDDLRERDHSVHHVDATTLPEVLDSFESLGRAVGSPPRPRSGGRRWPRPPRRLL